MNLLSNSLKFTFKGFIRIHVQDNLNNSMVNNRKSHDSLVRNESILIPRESKNSIKEPDREKRSITFSVEDSGIGIKDSEKDQLFKIFGKCSSSESFNP